MKYYDPEQKQLLPKSFDKVLQNLFPEDFWELDILEAYKKGNPPDGYELFKNGKHFAQINLIESKGYEVVESVTLTMPDWFRMAKDKGIKRCSIGQPVFYIFGYYKSLYKAFKSLNQFGNYTENKRTPIDFWG